MGGKITSYSLASELPLPEGLTLDPAEGIIYGTPAKASSRARYRIQGENSGGQTSAEIFITVSEVPPSDLTYGDAPFSYSYGVEIDPMFPSVRGGQPEEFSASPSLPSGLSMDKNGVISGVPFELINETAFTITARNSGGQTTTKVSIAVSAVPPGRIIYSPSEFVIEKDVPLLPSPPATMGGGDPDYYDIYPLLPEGLYFDKFRGDISGTPVSLLEKTNFVITAFNTGGNSSTTVSIAIVDNPPTSVSYTTPQAVYTVNQAIAVNSPKTAGGLVTLYSVSPSLPAGLSLNNSTGVISGTPQAAAIKQQHVITASNTGGQTTAVIAITVLDVPPIVSFTNPVMLLTKGSPSSSNTLILSGGAPTAFEVIPPLPAALKFDRKSLVITGIPREVMAETEFILVASNSGGVANASVTIRVVDIAPSSVVYSQPNVSYIKDVGIIPNVPSSQGGAPMKYSIDPTLPEGLELDASTGVITGTPTTTRDSSAYVVSVSNTGGVTNTTLFIGVRPLIPESLNYHQVDLTYVKDQQIEPNPPHLMDGVKLSFSVMPPLPPGLQLSSTNGTISGKPKVTSPYTKYTITGQNQAGTLTTDIFIRVEDAAPSNLTYAASTLTFQKDVPITPIAVVSVDGGVPERYTVEPDLPAGLILDDKTGTIRGTPMEAPKRAFLKITALNEGGRADATLELIINDVAPSNLVYFVMSADYTRGSPIEENVPTYEGGTIVEFTAEPSLPAGLSLSPSGSISGTPSRYSERAAYKITGTNSGGSTSATVLIAVKDVAPFELSYENTFVVLTVGEEMVQNLPTGDAQAVLNWSAVPQMPDGIVLDPSTGVISGTPSRVQSETGYIITGSNTAGSKQTRVLITVIDVPPCCLSYSNPNPVYKKGVEIERNVPQGNGGGFVIQYISNPSLPVGLTLDRATGEITGAALIARPSLNYTIIAQNSGGMTSTVLNITVLDDPPTALKYRKPKVVATVGVPIEANLPALQGGQPDVYSSEQALPEGIVLDSVTGEISGTPNVPIDEANFTIVASNAQGEARADVVFIIKQVAPNGLSFARSSMTVYYMGKSIPPNIASWEGGPPTSFAVEPPLPEGLFVDNNTGILQGVPQEVAEKITYTITASNQGGSTAATVVFTVVDVPPTAFSYVDIDAVYFISREIEPNVPIIQAGALQGFSYDKFLPNGLILDKDTGIISGTPRARVDRSRYTITTANSGGKISASIYITVVDPPPSNFTYLIPSPIYTIDQNIDANAPLVSGRVDRYTVEPTLPLGLEIDHLTGVITGTPSEFVEPSLFTVSAINSGGATMTAINLTIVDLPPYDLTYSPSSAVYVINKLVSNAPSVKGGRVVRYQITPALSQGLVFDIKTGVIGGTPSASAQTTNYTITASNSGGETSAVVSIQVIEKPIIGYSESDMVLTVMDEITPIVPTTSGSKADRWSVSPALVQGLTLKSDGSISGTPTRTAPRTSYTIIASNAAGSSSLKLALSVVDRPPVVPSDPVGLHLVLGQEMQPFALPLRGIVDEFKVAPDLPLGLGIDAENRAVVGTPLELVIPAAVYSVTAVNTGGSGVINLIIEVVEQVPRNLRFQRPNEYVINEQATSNKVLYEGDPVDRFDILPATLPPGLIFDEKSGAISGLPTQRITGAEFELAATNTGGTATLKFTVIVTDAAPSNFTYSVPAAIYSTHEPIVPNTPHNFGRPLIRYSVEPANLPAGLSLSSTTGEITGTPAGVTREALYRVTGVSSRGEALSTTVTIAVKLMDRPSVTYPNATDIRLDKGESVLLRPVNVGGLCTDYSVSPALPAGLTLNASTGVIAGNVLVPGKGTYRVVASNLAGSFEVPITIDVIDEAPAAFAYQDPSPVYLRGRSILANRPVILPVETLDPTGAVVYYTASPELPLGVYLHNSTGIIDGTPQVVLTEPSVFVVTGHNSGGNYSANITIVINDMPPYELRYDKANWRCNAPGNVGKPSNQGGVILHYSINPPLPEGLVLDSRYVVLQRLHFPSVTKSVAKHATNVHLLDSAMTTCRVQT